MRHLPTKVILCIFIHKKTRQGHHRALNVGNFIKVITVKVFCIAVIALQIFLPQAVSTSQFSRTVYLKFYFCGQCHEGQKRIVEGHLFHKIIPLIENPWVQCSHKIAVWVRRRVNNQPCVQDYPLLIIFKRAFAQKKKAAISILQMKE